MTELALNPDTLNNLHGILEAEIAHAAQVAEALRRKKEILVSGKPQLLGGIDQELLSLHRRAQQLEQERKAAMQTLGQPTWSLETLIGHLTGSQRSTFSLSRDHLRSNMDAVLRLNRESQDLLDLALHWIRDTVEVLSNALAPEATSYNAQGNKAKREGDNSPPSPMQSTISHSA